MQNTDFSYHQPIQSMSLCTLQNQKIVRPKTAVRDTMKVDDISGARAKFIQKPIRPRETFNNRNDDIARSKPKVLIPTEINRPQHNNMRVDDIQGTRSKMNKFTTIRNTNPLNPVYQLPHVEYYPVQEPHFIRDNMITYDIEGTSTKQSFAMRMEKQGKVLNGKQDVLKAIQLKKKSTLRRSQCTKLFDVTDICLKPNNVNKIKGSRCSNPLQPQYLLPSHPQKGSYVYGQIQKSKPFQHKPRQNNPNFNLSTGDITGAKPKINNLMMPAREEIKEAKVDSLKRGISSKRKTNPLNPTYNYPGWSEVQGGGYGEMASSQRPKTAHQRFDAFLGK